MKPYFAMPEDGWYNIAIAGEFPHSTGYVQVLDSEAFKAIVHDIHEQMGKPNWPGILIDFDHGSLDTDKPSTAAGWLTDIEERPDGLWAQIRWSDKGQKSLEGGEFRFVSPVWMLADCEELGEKRVRPRRIASCAITNAPNIRGMVPLTNRTEEKGVPLSPTGRALPIQERVQVPRAALEAIEKLENRRPLTEKQRKLLWARASGLYGGNGDSNPYQNANKAGRAAAGTPGKESKATTKDILEAKKQARNQSQYMHDYIQRKVKPEVQAKEDEQRRRYSAPEYRPGKKIKKYKDTWSGGKTWDKRNTGSKKYGKKLKKGKSIEKDLDQRRGRREDNAKETLEKSILSLVNRARLAAFLANTSWEDMTDQQRRWWWAQMGGGGSAVNPYTGEAPTSADNPWATEGTPSNPYAQLYGADMSPEESAFWREVYGNADDPNWTPSEEFGTTSDVDGLFSPEGWAAHQRLSQDLNQQLRDEYDRIARQEAIDYQNNLPAFTAPSTWDYFSAAVEDFGRGMAYGVGNLIDAIADIPQTTITGIPDLAALIAKGGSWLVGGSGNIAGGLESFAQSVHDLVDPKAQWVKDKTGLSSMIEELGEVWSGSDWAAKTSKISAGVFAAAVDMLVGLGGLAYAKGPEGIVKLGGTLNDATKIELGLVSKEQILARDIREAIRKLNIEEMTKNLDAEVLAKFAKEDLDDAVRHLDEALDLNRAMSAQRHMEEVTEIERRMAQANYDRARWAAQEADNAAEMARDAERLAKERAAQEWYDSNILKADREAEAARLANPMADAEARQLARENPPSLGTTPAGQALPERTSRIGPTAADDAARRAEEVAKAKSQSGWTWEQKHDQAYANQWDMSLEEAKAARLNREARTAAEETVAKRLNVPVEEVRNGTKYADEINAELGYAGNGKSLAFKADDPKAASFAERNPKWEKVTDADGTVHFERPKPTKNDLDDAVSRLNTQTKNEIVGGMYDAASRGGSYSDDAGRLLVDNGTVTPAGRQMIKEGVREQIGAGKAAAEKAGASGPVKLDNPDDVVKAIREAAIDKRNLAIDGGEYLVKDGKITDAGSELIDRIHMEGARVDTEAQWTAKGTATKGALDDAVSHMKPAQTATPTTETLDHAVEYFDRTLRPTRGTMVHTDEEIEGLVEEAIRKAQSGMPKEKADQIAKEVSDAIWDAQRKQVALRDASIERHNANMAANWQKYHEDDVYRHAGWEHLDLPPEEKEFLGKLIEKRAAEGGELLHPKQGTVLDGVALVEDGKLTKVGEIIAPDMKGKIPSSNTSGIREIPEPRKWDGWFDGGRDMSSVAEEAISKARRKAFAETMPTPKVELSEKQLAFLREHGTYGPEESVEAFKWLKEYSEVYKHGWDDKRIARMLTEGPWPGEGWRLEGRTLEGIKNDIAFQKMQKLGLLDPDHPIRTTPIRTKPTVGELEAAKEMLGKKIWEATSENAQQEAALLLRTRGGTVTQRDLIKAIEEWDGNIERSMAFTQREAANKLFGGGANQKAGFIDLDLFRVVGNGVKDFFRTPSVQEMARESDRIAAGITQSQATKRLMAATGGALTLPLIGAGLAKVDQRNMYAGNPYAFGTGMPENTRPEYASDNIPKYEMRRILEDGRNSGETDGSGGGAGGAKNNSAAAERAAAKVETAERMEQTQPAANLPEATPRPVRPTVEPTQEEIARVREQAGMTSRGTAADLQRAIDQLETERASLEARTYAVPVPEMRPTEYQNIQQVRRTAAAQPGATSTSIIAAVDKTKRQNADVSHLKAELDRAVKGLGSEKQRAKAEAEVLRRFNAAYFDAVERNEANDKNAAKRLQQIIDKLPRLEASKGYALQRAENAEERAESKLRRETQGKADAQYREELAAWRDSERARREQERNQRDTFRKTVRTVRQERRDAETRKKKTWRAALEGDRETFYQWTPDGDWDAAQKIVRAVQKLNQGGYKKGWEREASILGALYVQDPPLVTDGYEKNLG